MRIYFDTEFTHLEGPNPGDLISAGFVAEDGREWYIEISGFDQAICSEFVIKTVQPLLAHDPSEEIAVDQFSSHLVEWLTSFNEDVELVADYAGDTDLLKRYCMAEFDGLPHRLWFSVWEPDQTLAVRTALMETELRFWFANPGKQHHALYDARRLRMLVEKEREML